MQHALLVLMAGVLLACSKTTMQTGQVVALVPQQPATLALGGLGSAEATLTDLNDSRCPSDVVCFSAGTLAATVVLTAGSASQTVRLGYQKYYALDSATVTLNQQAYWVRLLNATPYPSTKNRGQLRIATLRLRPA